MGEVVALVKRIDNRTICGRTLVSSEEIQTFGYVDDGNTI